MINKMIEVSFAFGDESSDGVISYLVDNEPKNYGLNTRAYKRTLDRAFKQFILDNPDVILRCIQFRMFADTVLKVGDDHV